MMQRRRWFPWASVAVLWAAFGLLMYNAQAQSPTMDEQNHIARGYALWRTGDPRLSVEHPPFINLLEAAPLLLRERPQLPLEDASWAGGEWYRFATLFLWELNPDPDRIVFLARLPVVALTMLLAASAGRWAREVGGRRAGLMALSLVACDPNILAHGSLATTDIGITATALWAGYGVWRLAAAWKWRTALLTAVALGAMLGSKTSAPLFLGVFGLLFVGDALCAGQFRRALARLLLYGVLSFMALGVLWACYAFQVAPAVAGGLSVPMGSYWAGILAVFKNVQGGHVSYLLGQTILAGWPLYFPITFAVKTPLPVLGLLLLSIPTAVKRERRRVAIFLLTPVLLYWVFTLNSSLNLGYRHLLPTLPFLYVWAAQLAEGAPGKGGRITGRLAWMLSAWLAVEMVGIAPHFLAYFNPIGGGPERGWQVVADSNIDWGQDLKYLRDYLVEHQLYTIKLSWFGAAPPAAYGIAYEPLPGLPHHFNMWFEPPTFNEQHPEPGIYVISVSNLVELSLDAKHFFAYFRAREPDVRIGYSIYIYEVKAP